MSAGPLSDIRVLEFTTAWAGPFAGRLLAYLGAEVIKVEAPSHPDSWRGSRTGGAPFYYPELDPGAEPQNRTVLFNSQNIDKYSIALDLKSPGSDDVMRDLIGEADVIFANFTPGVLDRLGVGFSAASRINPRIIVVEMPAFGPGGPMSRHQGMGKTMEPATGMTSLMGYGDDKPVLTGPALMDPIGGLNAVAAIVTALEWRQRTGSGCAVQVPQVEAATHWIGEYVLEQVDTGRTWHPDGNHAPGFAPHDAFRCRGDDEWIVIAVADDRQWQALCAVMGRPELAARYATAADRTERQQELADVIGAWTANHDRIELAERLQQAGVPAAPVLGGADIAASPVMWRSGMIAELDHALVGRRSYSTAAFRLDRTPGGCHRAAPRFGEHNDVILRDLLGYDDTRIARLRESGAIADRPTADNDSPRESLPSQ